MAWAPPSKPGDTAPLISDAKKFLGKFSYGKGLGDTDEYTVEFGVALLQFQSNRKIEIDFGIKPGPPVTPNGVFDFATKKQMGLIVEPVKPLVVTVAGHLGNQFDGPAYICSKWMRDQGLTREMAIGYNNVDLPFKNKTGFDEVMKQVHDPVILPRNTNWVLCGHSQGAIVVADVLDVALAHPNEWPWTHLKGGVQFGNPRRPKGVVAPWISDPPPPDSEGIAHNCLKAAFPGMAEVSRKGDLYADKALKPDGKPTDASEYKTAIYRAVIGAGIVSGEDTLGEQIGELVKSFGWELWDIFMALVSAIGFAVKMDPHNIFDLGPCIDHLRRILAV